MTLVRLDMKAIKYTQSNLALFITGLLLALTIGLASLMLPTSAGAIKSNVSKESRSIFDEKMCPALKKINQSLYFKNCKSYLKQSDQNAAASKICNKYGKNKLKNQCKAYDAAIKPSGGKDDGKGGDDGKKGGDKDKDKGGPTGPFSLSAGDLGLDSSDPDASFKSILNGIYAVAGGVAVLIIVISGLLMVVNGDNAQNVADARNSVIYAAVGLAVVILAFVITNVVMAIV